MWHSLAVPVAVHCQVLLGRASTREIRSHAAPPGSVCSGAGAVYVQHGLVVSKVLQDKGKLTAAFLLCLPAD